MKGKDIIREMTRGKMPDIEAVRNHCHTQAMAEMPVKKRRRYATVAAVFILSLLFAGGVYAVGAYLGNRLDMGGMIEYVFVDADSPEYLARRENTIWITTLYQNPHVNNHWLFSVANLFLNTEQVAFVNEALAGQLFTAEGELIPYDFLTLDYEYLFNAYGEEIGMIQLEKQNEVEPLRVVIRTVAEHNAQWGYIDTHAGASAVLGATLRLPALNQERYHPPVFTVHDGFIKTATILFKTEGPPSQWLRIFAERVREEGTDAHAIYHPGEAVSLEIVGTTVHRITGGSPGVIYSTFYTWIHDGIVYRLTPPITPRSSARNYNHYSDDEMYEIIASMIR